MAWMIYGANGYTGQLIAELAGARGEKPILAGRNAGKVRALAERLGLPWRSFALDRPDLSDLQLVLHCAGPFSATSRQMVDACLAARCHYLDITGEVEVFESVLARDAEARERGVVLLPGTGFDVVPSDCLAASLKQRLSSATKLELAFASLGRASPGTLKTSIEAIPHGGLVRRGGKLVRVPTAWRSTKIPDITVFVAAKPSAIRAARLTRFTAPLLGLAPVQLFLKSRIERNVQGPAPEERARGGAQFWGCVRDGSRSVEMTMTIPEGYTFTATAALECTKRVLASGINAGAWTPSLAFGADFAASLPGVRVAVR